LTGNSREDMNMPGWLLATICVIALAGFIGFALRQGLKVKPDRENPDNWTDMAARQIVIPEVRTEQRDHSGQV